VPYIINTRVIYVLIWTSYMYHICHIHGTYICHTCLRICTHIFNMHHTYMMTYMYHTLNIYFPCMCILIWSYIKHICFIYLTCISSYMKCFTFMWVTHMPYMLTCMSPYLSHTYFSIYVGIYVNRHIYANIYVFFYMCHIWVFRMGNVMLLTIIYVAG